MTETNETTLIPPTPRRWGSLLPTLKARAMAWDYDPHRTGIEGRE